MKNLQDMAASLGGTIQETGRLPDGSGFATMSLPLPKDHWIYADRVDDPPAPMRIGRGADRDKLAAQIREAARYAVRGATMNGREMDFDPEALVQNMIWTEDGR